MPLSCTWGTFSLPPSNFPSRHSLPPSPSRSSSRSSSSLYCPRRAASRELSSTSPHGCELPPLVARRPSLCSSSQPAPFPAPWARAPPLQWMPRELTPWARPLLHGQRFLLPCAPTSPMETSRAPHGHGLLLPAPTLPIYLSHTTNTTFDNTPF